MKDQYHVVVVSSGVSGGTTAAHLARAGVNVLVLEGGPRTNTRVDFNTHSLLFQLPGRTIPIMRPGKAGFDSLRTYRVGDKTLLWNAVAPRFSQRDFKGRCAKAGMLVGRSTMRSWHLATRRSNGI